MNKIDLHIHTTVSDGEKNPEEIVDWAIRKNIKAIAITDHDTVDGSRRTIEYSKDKGVEVVSGIEVSCQESELDLFDIHIVGLFIDLDDKRIIEFTKKMKESRIEQKIKMLDILNELGYEITLDELKKEAAGGSYGKPHIAKILFRKYPEKFKTMKQVFDELLGNGKPADVHRRGVYNIKDTIKLIHCIGGIAILAHPGFLFDKAEKVIEIFVKSGGDGIEVDCDYRNLENTSEEEISNKFKLIAEKNNLLISGGGDFHSDKSHKDVGEYGVTESQFEKLKDLANVNRV